jgi:hypothetical protein
VSVDVVVVDAPQRSPYALNPSVPLEQVQTGGGAPAPARWLRTNPKTFGHVS